MNRSCRVAAAWLIAIVLVCQSGCGFRLRGEFELPESMSRTHVDGNPRSALVIALKRSLRSSAAAIVDTPQAASAVLRVYDERTGRRVLSVGNDGNVSEYEVYYEVSFALSYPQATGGEPRESPPAQSLRLTRDYVFDSSGVLGSGEEERTLREELRRDLVRLIMLRLQALG